MFPVVVVERDDEVSRSVELEVERAVVIPGLHRLDRETTAVADGDADETVVAHSLEHVGEHRLPVVEDQRGLGPAIDANELPVERAPAADDALGDAPVASSRRTGRLDRRGGSADTAGRTARVVIVVTTACGRDQRDARYDREQPASPWANR